MRKKNIDAPTVKITRQQKPRQKKDFKFQYLNKLLEEIEIYKQSMGRKKGREPHWKLFEYVNAVLESKKLVGLIIWKVSFPQNGITYLYKYFNVDEGICTTQAKRELVNIDQEISEIVKTLNVLIHSGIEWIIQEYPDSGKWIFDVFGDDAKKYLPKWHDYNFSGRSKNRPDYKNSLALLKRFLNGEGYKDLGFIKKKKIARKVFYDTENVVEKTLKLSGNFCTRSRPQGLIKLLHIAHVILYDSPKIVKDIMERITRPTFKETFLRAIAVKKPSSN